MTPEQIALPIMRSIGNRPRLSKQLFRFAKWGDPFAPERFSDPYEIYDTMTAKGPVVHSTAYQQWFVSGHDEILDVLRSPHTTTGSIVERMLSARPYSRLSDVAVRSFTNWLLVNDPPDHTRLRMVVNRAFTPKHIAAMAPRIRIITDELLRDIADESTVDIVEAFTSRLPIDAIAELLGLPVDRRRWLREASAQIGGLLEPFNGFDPEEMNDTFAALDDFFSELADQRRIAPQDDLISTLVATDDADEPVLTNDEAVAMIGMLMFAGHETTTGLLGNAIGALAKHPDQRRLLRGRPDIIDDAVEELLRYDSPAQFTGRITNGPIQAGDTLIPAGSTVSLMVGQANRDRRRWPDGDQLRLDRTDPKSISFGHGIHRCLGASLARLEAKVAIPAFLDAFGDYTVDLDTAVWKRSHSLRGPTRLTITRG